MRIFTRVLFNTLEEITMLRFVKAILVLVALIFIPAIAHAQASIVGTVRDSSGAVIPGVTVEASSPVLIEKAPLRGHQRVGPILH